MFERAEWHGWANADLLDGCNLLGVGRAVRGEGASPRRAREEQSEWPGSRGRGSKAARVDRCGSVGEWVGSGADISWWKASEDKTDEQRLAEWRAGASERTMVSRALVQATEEWLESDPATRVHWDWRAVVAVEGQRAVRLAAEDGRGGMDAFPRQAGWLELEEAGPVDEPPD